MDIPNVETEVNLKKIIAASSAGTLIEWYDFYIFGSLAATLSVVFFPPTAGAGALLSTLGVFAIGFGVRPFGAVFFGYIGDMIGRKYTFMITLLLMGGATFVIGLLPGFAIIGWVAPIALIVLRLLQGLALGGEYGGAATYVAEHCPDGSRGFWTSWIQTTATLGLFVSLGVILACRLWLSPEDFNSWGWRIPFLISSVLVGFSYYIRRSMHESPLFQRMKASGKTSKNPIKESFGNWVNLRLVLLALFGATAGQGVVWYTGQFYAMYFMKANPKVDLTLGIDPTQTEYMVSIALVLATPFFVVFGALSDKLGRKGIIMAGCLMALIFYYPIYTLMIATANIEDSTRYRLVENKPVGEPKSVRTEPDAARAIAGKTETTVIEDRTFEDGTKVTVRTVTTKFDDTTKPLDRRVFKSIQFTNVLTSTPAVILTFLVWLQVIFVTMVYGPIAAFLVELFPTKIRYTSMSLPYHIGNGMFGGMVPFIGTLMTEMYRSMYAGLWYPMFIAAITLMVGIFLVREKRDVKMHDEH